LRDFNACLIRDSARLCTGLLLEVVGNFIAPKRNRVCARFGGVGDHDKFVWVIAKAHQSRRRAEPREIDPAAKTFSSGVHS